MKTNCDEMLNRLKSAVTQNPDASTDPDISNVMVELIIFQVLLLSDKVEVSPYTLLDYMQREILKRERDGLLTDHAGFKETRDEN